MRFEAKLVLLFMGFAVLTAALMVAFSAQSRDLLERYRVENRNSYARVIHLSVQQLTQISGTRSDSTQQIIEKLKNVVDEVKEVTIVDRDGRVIASTRPQLVGLLQPVTSLDVQIADRPVSLDTSSRTSPIEVTVPLVRGGQPVGAVRSTVILRDLDYPLSILYYKNLAIAMAGLMVGLVTSLLVLRRLNRPLRKLNAAVQDLSGVAPVEPAEAGPADEVVRLERAFARLSARLAEHKELEARTNELEKRAVVAEIASHLAHEIRNPLNLIMLTAHHLGTQFAPHETSQRQRFEELVASLKSEVGQLDKVVSNFLSLGRPTSLDKVAFDVSVLARQVEVMVREKLRAKEARLEIVNDLGRPLVADQEQMRLVVLNLFLNAISAINKGGTVWFRTGLRNGRAQVLVEDTGPGFSPTEISRVFEPYFTGRPDGTGLGLALTKRIIEEHDGTIEVDNRPQGGARITISLPLQG